MGPLCGVCKSEFYHDGYVCHACSGTVGGSIAAVVLLGVCCGLALALMKYFQKAHLLDLASLFISTAKVKIIYVTSQVM